MTFKTGQRIRLVRNLAEDDFKCGELATFIRYQRIPVGSRCVTPDGTERGILAVELDCVVQYDSHKGEAIELSSSFEAVVPETIVAFGMQVGSRVRVKPGASKDEYKGCDGSVATVTAEYNGTDLDLPDVLKGLFLYLVSGPTGRSWYVEFGDKSLAREDGLPHLFGEDRLELLDVSSAVGPSTLKH